MSDFADPERISEQVSVWTQGQVRCRAYNNHAWSPYTVTEHPRTGVYSVTQRCSRCRNRRRQTLSAQGYVLQRWRMVYGQGYLLPKGTGRVDDDGRAVLRLADLSSLTITQEAVDEDDVNEVAG